MPVAALVLALTLAHGTLQHPPRMMVIAPAPNREVLMIRRAPDNSIETACVDNDDAARAFLGGAKSTTARPKQ